MGCVSLLIAAWLAAEGRKSCLRSFSRLARWRFAPPRYRMQSISLRYCWFENSQGVLGWRGGLSMTSHARVEPDRAPTGFAVAQDEMVEHLTD